MVDKVASAAIEAIKAGDSVYVRDDGNTFLIDGDVDMKAVARAAIQAMREPTQAMLDAVSKAEEDGGYIAAAFEHMEVDDAWPIMIDAALAGG
ncbi:hypothetical protein EN742_21550 [Mesorhizobium sp. M4A.F.Ca.ET.020.02.1.1]|nr:hypothetical protein EN742_21550 [Mesorhizobium sp. M4A.F.Ca.ET.020.02.1.1]